MKYAISVRGPVPPGLGHKLAAAHAQAIRTNKRRGTPCKSAPLEDQRVTNAASRP